MLAGWSEKQKVVGSRPSMDKTWMAPEKYQGACIGPHNELVTHPEMHPPQKLIKPAKKMTSLGSAYANRAGYSYHH